MQEIIEKMLRLQEADKLTQDEFSSDVELSVHVDGLKPGEESSGPDKVSIIYSIYTEWRSWGLKDISVIPRGKVEFEVEITDVDDNVIDTISVNIDFDSDDVKLQWMSGGGYAPESLEVRVDRTGKLIDADLNFYFQDHS